LLLFRFDRHRQKFSTYSETGFDKSTFQLDWGIKKN